MRFAAAAAAACPGIGPKTAERLAELGFTRSASSSRPTRSVLAAALRRPPGPLPEGARELPRRLAGRAASRRRRSRARPRRRSTTTSPTLAELEAVLRQARGELCEGLPERERRGRTIAIKVRLDDWTTVTRARTLEAPTNDARMVTDVALELLRAYAPPRPVRLLGVRVASFEDVVEAPRLPPPPVVGQLALDV